MYKENRLENPTMLPNNLFLEKNVIGHDLDINLTPIFWDLMETQEIDFCEVTEISMSMYH